MASDEQAINVSAILSNNLQNKHVYELSEKAANIALQNFDWRYMTFVYFNTSLCFGVDLFLNLYGKAVVLGRGLHYPKIVGKTGQYVLFGSDLNNIFHSLEWMKQHEFDNTGRYIIICQSIEMFLCDEYKAIQTLWQYKITNVVYLKTDQNESVGFTFFPLDNSSCVYDDPVRLTNLTSCLDDPEELCDLYPVKLVNFNGCQLIVSTFLQMPFMYINNGVPSGTDGDLLLLIAEKLNASLTVMTPKIGHGWGKMEKDGSWSGSLADVYYDLANFSMTSSALTLSRFSNFQLSTEYTTTYVAWIMHTPKKVPSSLKLSYPFQAYARIALGATFAVVVICSLIFHSKFYLKLSRELDLGRPQSVVFYSWTICMGLGVPQTRLPKKAALLNVVLLWIWYCILVRTFYQVSLITAMKTNYYFDVFIDIDDAIENEYPIGGGAALRDYYIDYPPVYNKWQEVETTDIIPTLRNISTGTEFVLAMSLLTAKTIIWKEKITVHILPEKVVTTPSVVFFKKFSPLADAVNIALDSLHAAGFSIKSFHDYAPEVRQTDDDSLESIKLEHYTGCYALLLSGWVASFLLFVIEYFFVRFFRLIPVIEDYKN